MPKKKPAAEKEAEALVVKVTDAKKREYTRAAALDRAESVSAWVKALMERRLGEIDALIKSGAHESFWVCYECTATNPPWLSKCRECGAIPKKS